MSNGSDSSATGDTVRIDVAHLRNRLTAILQSHEVPADNAAEVVDVLVSAQMMGRPDEGLACFLPYLERLRRGLLDPVARPRVVADGDGVMVLDANNGFGPVAAIDAGRRAADRARSFGCAWIVTRNANHIGTPAYYARLLARRGLLGVCFSNDAPTLAAWGGDRTVLGTNPFALGAPSNGNGIWSMLRAGRPISTTPNPAQPVPSLGAPGGNGPMAGPDGSNLLIMLDLFTSLAAQGSPSTKVRGLSDLSGPAGVCFTLIAADLYRITERDDYTQQLGEFCTNIKSSSNSGSLPLPGEVESAAIADAEQNGLVLAASFMRSLDEL